MSGLGSARARLRPLGQGRPVDFDDWCRARRGRSYVSDGYAHALEFNVGGQSPGFENIHLDKPGKVTATAKVASAAETPLPTAFGGGAQKPKRLVELVVNGVAVASKEVPADNRVHELTFEVPLERSSWVALRHFPQLHTNPVIVLVGGKPIRASRKAPSGALALLNNSGAPRAGIAEHERREAHQTFLKVIEQYQTIAKEAPEGS